MENLTVSTRSPLTPYVVSLSSTLRLIHSAVNRSQTPWRHRSRKSCSCLLRMIAPTQLNQSIVTKAIRGNWFGKSQTTNRPPNSLPAFGEYVTGSFSRRIQSHEKPQTTQERRTVPHDVFVFVVSLCGWKSTRVIHPSQA